MAHQESKQSPNAKPGFFYGYIIVIAALFLILIFFGTRYSFGVFFKPVLTEFGWTRATTSGAFSLSTVTTGLLGIVMGGLSDRFGPRMVLTICSILLGMGYLLMSQLGTLWQLYLFYGVIIGIGMSGVRIALLSTIARWFTKRRSMMTGIFMSGTGIGTLIAAPVANWLISTYDWRMSYLIMGSLVLVIAVVAAQLLRRDPGQMRQVPYGEDKDRLVPITRGSGGFSLREAFHTRQFWLFFTTCWCFGFGFNSVMVHIVAHALHLGIPAAGAANILAAIGGLAIAGRIVMGTAADKIGNRQAYIIGFILMSASFFWLVPSRELWMLYLFSIVYGFGHGGIAPSGSPMVAGLFGLRSHGLIFGVMSLGFEVGGAIGPFLSGYIFDITNSYQSAFLVCGAISIVGLVLTSLLQPINKNLSQYEVSATI